jgi:hypothetical protein
VVERDGKRRFVFFGAYSLKINVVDVKHGIIA